MEVVLMDFPMLMGLAGIVCGSFLISGIIRAMT